MHALACIEKCEDVLLYVSLSSRLTSEREINGKKEKNMQQNQYFRVFHIFVGHSYRIGGQLDTGWRIVGCKRTQIVKSKMYMIYN